MKHDNASSLPARDTTPRVESPDLADRWHTAALITLILGVAVVGTLLSRLSNLPAPPLDRSRIAGSYVPSIVVQWSLLVYVCRVGRTRNALPSLLGARSWTPREVGIDLLLASAGSLLIQACELVGAKWLGAVDDLGLAAILPRSWPERLAWIVVAVSAGFCEEVVYRGYLQTQLTAFTRRASMAIVLQACLFGIAHAEQGLGTIIRVAFYGLGFGVLAWWRKGLVPGIVCHVWIDLHSGLAG